jgi:murein L,D-transpeptidase YcbB/YkuD
MRPELLPFRPSRHFSAGKILCFALFLLLSFTVNGHARPTNSDISKAMSQYMVCSPLELMQVKEHLPTLATRELCLATIYTETGMQPLWVTGEGPTEKGEIILRYLKNSSQHGLDPREYQVDRLLDLWSTEEVDEFAELDTILTYNLVKYVHDISYGQLKPLESDPELFAEAGDQSFNPVLTIKQILVTGDLEIFLASLPPQHSHYRALQGGLEYYRKIAAQGGWSTVAEGPSLRPGDTDERIKAVRKRLQVTNPSLMTPDDTAVTSYDLQLEQAVLEFQQQHGLEPDGIVGKNTVAAMNISAEEKVTSILMNMARWRWHAHDLGEKYVLVNIAGFNLKAFQGEEIALDIPVIVGQQQHETPVFSDNIKYIDFNPFWNITPNIARNEELPELRKNKNHLVDRHVRLFSSWQEDAVELDSTAIDWHNVSRSQIAGYKLRQDPGPWNALGKIKFVFPNKYAVYMHDTPAHNLFNRTQRDFSHGCIRVSDVLSLAIFLLKDQRDGRSAEEIEEIYNQDQRRVIRLSEPVPVHITYQTAWVDKSGTIRFNRDLYGRDTKLQEALANNSFIPSQLPPANG